MMKALVNGSTGLVGGSVVRAFLEGGNEVRVSDRPGSDFREWEKLGLEVAPAELDDVKALARAVAGVDVVVHVAGVFDFGAAPALLEKVNHQGTRNMCEAVLEHAPNLTRFVQVATVGVYGRPVRCPCRESDPKDPRNAYEQSKWRGEMAAFEYHAKRGLPVTAIRPTLVYGPQARYGHAMYIAGMCLMKIMGLNVLYAMRSGPTTSHVHVDDVGRAALTAAKSDRAVGNAYTIADPNPLDGITFMRALTDPLGIELKPVVPLFSPMMSVFEPLLRHSPHWPENKLNQWLSGAWKKACAERGLTNDLRLRLDRDWLGYMTGDNYYDVSALKDIGMQWKWPDAVEGLRQTIEWYKEKEWIP
jgi:nucleoside-diphosphate-sugar epimerase